MASTARTGAAARRTTRDDGRAVAVRVRGRGALLASDRAALPRGRGVSGDRANRAPDHTTISRFRQWHAERLAALFVQVLRMCEKAGMVRVGTVAVDGTK